jgi:1-phosphofructokinase
LIVTVTPNPSVDRTLRVPPLVRGGVHRATSSTSEAGGKGINVARALATEGHETLAVAPLSAASAGLMLALLGGVVRLEAVPIAGEVRVNVGLVEDDGTVTKVNEPGPRLSEAEAEALLAQTAALAAGATWLAGCGSLPPGVPAEFYAELARRAPVGVRVAVDADGPALRACRGRPLGLIKPNHHELEGLLERALPTLGDVVAGARELTDEGIEAVLVSLGPDGAVLVDRDGASHAEARVDDVLNTVGAGDALLAGFLAAGGRRDGLATAVAWSVAACRSPGTQMRRVTAEDVAAVTVHANVDGDRRLAA